MPYLLFILRQTMWQVFAAAAALPVFIVGLFLLLYPEAYAVSKAYHVMQAMVPDARVLGAVALLLSCSVVALLSSHHLRVPLLGLVALLIFFTVASFLATGLSSGTAIFATWAASAIYAMLRSGGFRKQEVKS
jgi:hypothetical protein